MTEQTYAKICKYQSDYQMVAEQSAVLNSQMGALEQELAELWEYLQSNSNDLKSKQKYNSIRQRINRLANQLRHNDIKLASIQRQLTIENQRAEQQNQRLLQQQQKRLMSAYRKELRRMGYN